MNKGGRNLIILGVSAVIIAILTTTISVIVYHSSGDIYLDRSRPGFLPEKVEEEPKEEYVFSDDGTINSDVVDEYVEEFQKIIDYIDKLEDAYSSNPLSDSTLGIPTGENSVSE
ncbi:hypothetical protein IJI94_01185 [Candidatus Saccharibacteria bacterium]|nr:hypothetical protein [Candidatus Saccharibacteria bacterium]